jgi:2-methylcitrate dehydratase PrpD
MAADYDASRVTSGLGSTWKILETCYKLYSCCGHTHSAIDCALELREQLGWQEPERVEQVEDVAVYTYGPGWAIVKEMNPRTAYAAKFSLAYVVAAALAEGRVGLQQFAPERFAAGGISDPNIAALLPRVRVAVSEEMTARYPAAWPARVAVKLRNGRMVERASEYPRGNPENPVATAVLEKKFRGLIEPRFGRSVAESAISRVRELEHVSNMASVFSDVIQDGPGSPRSKQ